MDGNRFDALTRLLAAKASRRTGAAGALAGVFVAAAARPGGARRDVWAAEAPVQLAVPDGDPAAAGSRRDTLCWNGRNVAACLTGAAGCARCSRSAEPVCQGNQCIAGSWSVQDYFGRRGNGANCLRSPEGVFLSADARTAWVADSENSRISVWIRADSSQRSWIFSTDFGSNGLEATNLRYPEDMTASSDTLTAWVADTQNHRISIWTRPNPASTAWSFAASFGSRGRGNSGLRFPESVAVSPDTLTAWVADTRNHRVSIWFRPNDRSTEWRPLTRFGRRGAGDGDFEAPRSIAVAPDTLTAWIADDGNHRVSVWTRPDRASNAWSPAARFGSATPGAGYLGSPNGVAIAPDSLTAVVADVEKSRISVWTRA